MALPGALEQANTSALDLSSYYDRVDGGKATVDILSSILRDQGLSDKGITDYFDIFKQNPNIQVTGAGFDSPDEVERKRLASDAEAERGYAAQRAEAAANVTDLGNGYVQIADGRIFDPQGNQVSSVPTAVSTVAGATGADTVTGASGANTTTGAISTALAQRDAATGADTTAVTNVSTAATAPITSSWTGGYWSGYGDDREYVPRVWNAEDSLFKTSQEEDAAIAAQNAALYTGGSWPTIDLGSAGDDLEVGRKGSVSDGTSLYLYDQNDGVWYRNPDTVETFSYVTGPDGKRYVAVHAPVFSTGVEPHEAPVTSYMTEEQYKALKGSGAFAGLINSPVGQFGLALLGPYGQAFNSAYQLGQGNTTGAILSGLNAYGQFAGADAAALQAAGASGDAINASQLLDLQNSAANARLASTVIGGIDAATKGNIAGVINAGVSGASQAGVTLPSGVTTAVQLANVATAFQNGNGSAFLNALGDLAGSADLKTAAAAANLLQIATGPNPSIGAIYGAVQNLTSAASASTNASTTTKTGDAGAAAFVAAKNARASDADAFAASKAIDTQLENAVIFDASDSDSLTSAGAAAKEAGYDQFKFNGKTYTFTVNEDKKVADFEASVLADTTAANLKGGEFEGVDKAVADQKAAAQLKIVAVGNAEADNPDEAAYVAKQRDPTATQFTYGGKTYTMGTSNAAMNAAVLADKLSLISSEPKFADAYSQARDLLGPNKTFTWNGKEYSTATAAERPDLTGKTTTPPVGEATDQSAAETARLNNLNAGLAANAPPSKVDAAKAAINSVLGDGFASNLVTQGLSNIHQATGQTLAFFGGTASALGLAGPNNTLTQAGNAQTQAGEGLQLESINKANSNVISAVQKADGFIPKVVAGAKAIIENPLSANMAAIEILQEALPIGVAAKVYGLAGKYAAIGVDVALNAIESGGAAYNERYNADIKAGVPKEKADSDATKSFWVASAVTAVTGGITDMALVNKITKTLDDAAAKAVTRPVSTGAVSAAKEAPSEAAEVFATGVLTALALGETPDINKILTQTIVEGYVGGKTAGAIDTTDSAINATTGDYSNVAGTTGSTAGAVGGGSPGGGLGNVDLGAVGAVTPGADVVTGTDLGSIGSVIPGSDAVVGGASTLGGTGATTISVADAQTVMGDLGLNVSNDTAVSLATKINNVTTQIGSGADASVVAGTAVTGAITAGASADAAVGSTVTAAVTAGGNASTVVGSSVTAAVAAGGDASTVVGSSVTAAVTAGADASTVVGSSVTAAVTAGADASSVVGSSITAAVTAGADASTVIGSSVTAAVTSGADASTVVGAAITTASTAGSNTSTVVGSAVAAAVTSGGDVNGVVGTSVATVANTGGDVTTAAGAAVAAAVNSGGDVTVAVGAAVAAAANAGSGVDTAVASTVSSAINSGANAATAVAAAVDAATTAGNDVTVATTANTTTISNATTNSTTTVDNNTGVTSTIDGNTGVTTTVDAANNLTTTFDANNNVTTTVNAATGTTTAVDANNNTTTQTTSNANSTTTTTFDANNNVTSQVTTNNNTNIQTNVTTNVNANTQVTTKVNADTGEIIEKTETSIPPDWSPPVIEQPVIPDPVTFTATPTSTGTPTVKATPTAKLSGSGAAIAGGVMGLPSTFDIDPAMLGSKVTQGKIDPLARVREAQAELERDIMMSQIDPRLMSVMQQRMDPNQQAKQLDQDVGALAKMLRGESPNPSAPDVPANEGKYYAYGAEDSIDDILGGKAVNYKAGGFVEPLKASGGMVLPLLAKSGGALGKYNGREDFKGGKHVAGEGDGQSDDIPAWLADGEFVFPADVVSALGNGSTKAGTDKLYEMMHGIRDRARSKGPKDLPPPALKSALDYLKSSKRSK